MTIDGIGVMKLISIMLYGAGISMVLVLWGMYKELKKRDDQIRRLKKQNHELEGRLTMTADELYTHLLNRQDEHGWSDEAP